MRVGRRRIAIDCVASNEGAVLMSYKSSLSIKLVLLLVLVTSSVKLARIHAQTKSTAPAATGSASLPRFDRVFLLEQTSETSANVSIGDLNGDGYPDIVLAKGRHWPLRIRHSLGAFC